MILKQFIEYEILQQNLNIWKIPVYNNIHRTVRELWLLSGHLGCLFNKLSLPSSGKNFQQKSVLLTKPTFYLYNN